MRQEKIDKSISGFITYHFVMSGVIWLFSGILILKPYEPIVSYIYWPLFFIWFAYLLRPVRLLSNGVFFKAYSIFICLYLLGIVICTLRGKPVDILLKHDALWTFVYYLPLGLSAYVLKNYKQLYETMYRYSYIVTICCTIIFVYHVLNPFNTYDMTFGYILLVPTILHFSWYFSHRSDTYVLIIAILEIAMLLLYGSRGVLLSIAIFFLLRFYVFGKRNTHQGIIIFGVILIGLFFGYGAPLINDYLETQGVYSRTISAFSDMDYDQTGTRNENWNTGLSLIMQKPIIGYGLGGYYYDFHEQHIKNNPDKQYIFDPIIREYKVSTVSYGGCHSGFLELLAFFGILVGLPLAFWIIFSIFKVKKYKNKEFLELILLFYSVYIVPNMIVSSGLHYKPGCAIYLFLYLSFLIKYKNKYEYNNIDRVLLPTSAPKSI